MAIIAFFPNIFISVKATSSPAISINSPAATRSLILTNHHVKLQTASNSLKKFKTVIKVFEDKKSGVICYRDERGELICEGYDEGPRLSWQQVEAKLEELVEGGLGCKLMNFSTEALNVMMEIKRFDSGRKISC